MLEESVIELPFKGGVDEKTASEHVAPGSFLSMLNAHQKDTGAIERRPGTGFYANNVSSGYLAQDTPVPGMTAGENDPGATPHKCFVSRGKLCKITDRGYIYEYSDATEQWNWIDHAPEAVVTRQYEASFPDYVPMGSAIHSDMACTVSCGYTGSGWEILATICNATTGAMIYQEVVAGSLTMGAAQIIAIGTAFYVVYYDNSVLRTHVISGGVGGTGFSTTNPSIVTATIQAFDIAEIEGATSGARYVVAWIDDTPHAVCQKFDSSGAAVDSAFTSGIAPTYDSDSGSGIGVKAYSSDDVIAMVFSKTTGGATFWLAISSVKLSDMTSWGEDDTTIQLDTTGLGTAAARRISLYRWAASVWLVAWDEQADPTDLSYLWYRVKYAYFATSNGVAYTSTPLVINRAQMASKILDYNDRAYLLVNCYDANPQEARAPFYTYAMVDLHIGRDPIESEIRGLEDDCICRLVAQFGNGEALPREITPTFSGTGTDTSWFCVPGWVAVSDTKRNICLPVFTDVKLSDNTYDSELIYKYSPRKSQMFAVDFDDPANNMTVEFGGVTLMTGGVLSVYDGTICGEVGFVHPPAFYGGLAAGAGSILVDGDYDYLATYAHYDATGNVYRSALSDSRTFTVTGGPKSIKAKPTNISVTNWGDKFSSVYNYIELYRRTGTAAYKQLTDLVSPIMPAVNDRSSPTGSPFDDLTTAAKLADNADIYTDGSPEALLEHDPPPSCRFIEVWNNRVWLAGCEKGRELWPSNEYVQGEGVSFSQLTVVTIEDEGGDITGIKAMDDALVIFKAGRIYRMYGEGANDVGQGATLTRPSLVSAEYGCIAGHALLLTKHGIWFLSKRGLCLLNRQFQVEHVGAPMQTTINSMARMTGAAAMPGTDLLLFGFHYSNDDSQGVTVVYNTDENTWGTWSLIDSDGDIRGPTSFCIYPYGTVDEVHFVDELSGVVRHYSALATLDAGLTLDGDHTFDMVVETPWYTTGSNMAWQRVRRLLLQGRYIDSHQITVEVAYDYATEYESTSATFTRGIVDQDPTDPGYMIRWPLPRQICSAVRFRITMSRDAGDNTDTAQGSLIASRLEIAKRPQRSVKLPAQATR